MIDKVVIRNWKKFDEIEFDLERRHVVLVGPNNCGKTSVLQALAAWGFALRNWRQQNTDLNRRRNWPQIPVTLDQFTPVSVLAFDLLWRQRQTANPVTIEVHSGLSHVGIELESDVRSPLQMFVRPTQTTTATEIHDLTVPTLFVPSMTGMLKSEPALKTAKVDQLLGQNRPGEVLRNMLADAAGNELEWKRLTDSIRELFGIELLRPNSQAADIIANYRHAGSQVDYDLASGGSGFLQVVMLLSFMSRGPQSLLLLDEPDAHLHVFLQERIVEVLRSAAARTQSQMIVATHSEVVLDTVDLDEIYVLLEQPRRISDVKDKATLKEALRVIDHNDLAKAREAPGILYLEDYTDLAILREWARVLQHPAEKVLGPHVYWRQVAADLGYKRAGISAEDHFAALRLARPDYPGFQLVDGDSKKMQGPKGQTFGTPPKRRWPRYEIESYLVHPRALERFVAQQTGSAPDGAMAQKLAELLTPEFEQAPMTPTKPAQAVLDNDKARTELLPPILDAGGLLAFPYKRYHEIAAQMLPDEIHQDVRDVLDAICTAFGIPLPSPTPNGGGA